MTEAASVGGLFFKLSAIGTSRHFAAPQQSVVIGGIADSAAQLQVCEFTASSSEGASRATHLLRHTLGRIRPF